MAFSGERWYVLKILECLTESRFFIKTLCYALGCLISFAHRYYKAWQGSDKFFVGPK